MLNDAQRKILEQLARKLAHTGIRRGNEVPKTQPPSCDVPAGISSDGGSAQDLHKLLADNTIDTAFGPLCLLRRSVCQLWSQGAEAARYYRWAVGGAGQRLLAEDDCPQDLARLIQSPLGRTVYLDIETCGLAGAVVFLAGLLWLDDDDFVAEQLFALNYPQEAALIGQTARRLTQFDVVVSFNGKRFDIPTLQERAAFHRVQWPSLPTHVDLLDWARRRWGKLLPNCKLQTLETFLCRRRRIDDIPGWDIPQAYHDFVRDGKAGKIKQILHHNLLDLLTMAQLVAALTANEDPDF